MFLILVHGNWLVPALSLPMCGINQQMGELLNQVTSQKNDSWDDPPSKNCKRWDFINNYPSSPGLSHFIGITFATSVIYKLGLKKHGERI